MVYLCKALPVSIDFVDIDNGKAFPEPFRFYLVLFVSIFMVALTQQWLGLSFSLVALWGITAKRGTIVTKRGHKRYFSVLGFKFGTEVPFQEGEQLVIIRENEGIRYGSHGGQLNSNTLELWKMYLVNKNHRNKRSFGTARDKKLLEDKANKILKISGVETRPFRPVISRATRLRKRR